MARSHTTKYRKCSTSLLPEHDVVGLCAACRRWGGVGAVGAMGTARGSFENSSEFRHFAIQLKTHILKFGPNSEFWNLDRDDAAPHRSPCTPALPTSHKPRWARRNALAAGEAWGWWGTVGTATVSGVQTRDSRSRKTKVSHPPPANPEIQR